MADTAQQRLFQLVDDAGEPVVSLWRRLTRPTESPPRFERSLVAELPEPARRWLTHTITPGTPLARAVLLEMEGQIRVGRWLPFHAAQVLAPPAGFVWAARAGWGPLSIRGYDRYGDGTGEMRWQLAGRIPIMHADGPDIDRSAAGRLAAEAVLVPTAFLGPGVTWHATSGRDTATAEWSIGAHSIHANLHLDSNSAARSDHDEAGQPRA